MHWKEARQRRKRGTAVLSRCLAQDPAKAWLEAYRTIFRYAFTDLPAVHHQRAHRRLFAGQTDDLGGQAVDAGPPTPGTAGRIEQLRLLAAYPGGAQLAAQDVGAVAGG